MAIDETRTVQEFAVLIASDPSQFYTLWWDPAQRYIYYVRGGYPPISGRAGPFSTGNTNLPVQDVRTTAALGTASWFTVIGANLAPAANTNRVVMRLRNPTGNTANAVVTYALFSANPGRSWQINVAKGTADRTSADFGFNKADTSLATQGSGSDLILTHATNAASDVVGAGAAKPLQTSVPFVYSEPFLIQPGFYADFQVGDANSVTTDAYNIYAEWYETPI